MARPDKKVKFSGKVKGKFVDTKPQIPSLVHERLSFRDFIDEAIFDPTRYEWRRYQGKDNYTLDYRGKPHSLKAGDVFGLRKATSKKDFGKSRVILPHMGQNRVMSVPSDAALRQNSKFFPQMQRAVAEQLDEAIRLRLQKAFSKRS